MKWKHAGLSLMLVASVIVSSIGLRTVSAVALPVGMDEDFNSFTVGNFSGVSNWNPSLSADGAIQVVADETPADHSIRMEKTSTSSTTNLTLDRKNLSESGKVVVSYRVRTDEISGTKSAPYIYGSTTSNNMISFSLSGSNINAYNGATSTTIYTGLIAKQWYHIQFTLDTTSKKYDVYIDGMQKASGFAFRDTTVNTDTLSLIRFSIDKATKGTLQFDDVFVDQLPSALSMEPSYHLSINSTHASQVNGIYSDHSVSLNTKAYYSSSDPTIAAVDDNGLVSGLKAGTATITARVGGMAASTLVSVDPLSVLNRVQLDQPSYTLLEGQQQLTVLTAVYSNGPFVVNGYPGVSFTSSNPTVVTVDSSGIMNAIHYGASVLIATYGGKSTSADVTVMPILSGLQSVSPGPAGFNLMANETGQSVIQAVYSDGTVKDVSAVATYVSDDTSIARVDSSGTVLGVTAGQTVITATYDSKDVKIPVRVSSLHLDADSYTLALNATHNTLVSLIGPDGNSTDVTKQSLFLSGDPAVIAVDANGKVTGLRTGTTSLTVTYGTTQVVANAAVLGGSMSSTFSIAPEALNSQLSLLVSAGMNGTSLSDGTIYSVQTEIVYDPSVLQLVEVKPLMFTGTAKAINETDSIFVDAGQSTGYQSVVLPDDHRILYAATHISSAGSTQSENRKKGLTNLVFRVLKPGVTSQIQVNDLRLGLLKESTILGASPDQIFMEKPTPEPPKVPPKVTVSYSSTVSTNKDVIATITSSEPVTITNNNGSTSHTFMSNGSFVFEYVDAYGNKGTVTAAVALIDKVAPTLKVTVDKPVIRPPNHKMIPIKVTLQADGTGSGIASIVLTSITSNESDNGSGDGDTSEDIQDAEFGIQDTSFSLRAERSGKGSGRIYTITYTVTDEAGNAAVATAAVVVPH